MARPLRIEFPVAVYHITSRGNERKKIYLNDHDREIFQRTLRLVIDQIPRLQRYASQETLDRIYYNGARRGRDRDELIHLSYVRHGYTMKELADYLGSHYVSISRAIKRVEDKKQKL